jgi:hypothetical protein
MEFLPCRISTPKPTVMKILLTSLLLIICSSVSAQTGAIKGTLTDRETAETVVFATVKLFRNDSLIIGTTSDFDGRYTLQPVSPGTYTLKITSIDYEELVVQQQAPLAGRMWGA